MRVDFNTQDYLDNRTKTFDSRTCPDFLNEQEIELFNYYWKHLTENIL